MTATRCHCERSDEAISAEPAVIFRDGRMSESTNREMTLAEFLRWEDGTETHYELINGSPRPLPLKLEGDRVLAVRLGSAIEAVLSKRRPCNAQFSAGIVP